VLLPVDRRPSCATGNAGAGEQTRTGAGTGVAAGIDFIYCVMRLATTEGINIFGGRTISCQSRILRTGVGLLVYDETFIESAYVDCLSGKLSLRNLRSHPSSGDVVDDERAEMSVVLLASFIAVISDIFLHDLVVEERVELPVEVEVEVDVVVAVKPSCPVIGKGVT
jgi:hypothetical protein